MTTPSMKNKMKIIRYYAKAILLISLALILISPALTSNYSQAREITAPVCATKNALGDLTISSIVTVFSAGLLAGFNPCILAILAFLASSMFAITGRRMDILAMVAAFSLGMFAVYIIFLEWAYSEFYKRIPLQLSSAYLLQPYYWL